MFSKIIFFPKGRCKGDLFWQLDRQGVNFTNPLFLRPFQNNYCYIELDKLNLAWGFGFNDLANFFKWFSRAPK